MRIRSCLRWLPQIPFTSCDLIAKYGNVMLKIQNLTPCFLLTKWDQIQFKCEAIIKVFLNKIFKNVFKGGLQCKCDNC